MTTNRPLVDTSAAWIDPTGQPNEWQRTKKGRIYAGRAGQTYVGEIYWDYSTIEAQVVLDEVLCLARPQYRLDQCVRTVAAPSLTLKIDSGTTTSAQTKVKPLEEAIIDTVGFSRTTFDLWKNVAHVVVEDEVGKGASHDVLRINIEDAAGAIASARNTQIATELETATTAAGVDWGLMTTPPNSDFNPFPSLCGVIKTLEGNGFEPNFMAVDPSAWCEFITNTYVRDLVQAGILTVPTSGTPKVTLPGYPTINVVLDTALTDTVAVVGSTRATVLAEGPTEAAKYRNEPKGYTGYIIRQWLQPEIICTSGIRQLTGVTA